MGTASEIAAGVSAGVLGTLTAFPFEVHETRIACSAATKSRSTSVARLPLTDLAFSLGSSISGNLAFFVTNSMLVDCWSQSFRMTSASVASTLCNTPFQVLKTRAIAGNAQAATSIAALMRTETAHGITTLWTRGGILSLISSVAGTTIQWMTYTALLSLSDRNLLASRSLVSSEVSPLMSAGAGLLASMTTALLMHPVNLVKTNLMSQAAGKERSAKAIVHQVVRCSGPWGLWAGLWQAQMRTVVPTLCNFFALPVLAKAFG